ncbi:CoA pyrophosphatase [Calidifontibacter sp. DB0510]|uniref:CoA pyrophosphatase n=1 Tax=Metallococcus carri TaxID=1656884 RepID=A0A967E9W7_9MICO|nr:CoA pyrophosphatase [Metallococcus carri]NHN56837.1 CoA pyrophosphatase [Metallococcus carri]NOP37786.1 CoA pyrophosphatase [Calidifontibacter sp. DB2511S]
MTAAPVPGWLADLPAHAAREGGFFAGFGPIEGRHSAVLLLFGPHTGGGEDVVLTERSATLRQHAGQVSFPGGTVDAGDADDADTALREAWEETGLERSAVEVIGTLPAIPLSVTGFRVVPVAAWWPDPHPLGVRDPAEVARVERVSLAALADPAHRFTATHPRRGFAAPAFEIDGLYVWGFTAIVLDALLHLSGYERPWDTDDRRQVPDRFLR